MQQPEKIPVAFASSGDRNNIAKTTDQLGLASWSDGFPAICSQPFLEGGIAPKRADFNGIFYAMSRALLWAQQGGIFAYDTATDYEPGNIVTEGNTLYVANAANGVSSEVVSPSGDTAGVTWRPLLTAYAPELLNSPAKTDNSRKVATTEFVNSRLPYTTGNWTPVLQGVTTAGKFTYSAQNGYYYKIGNLVFLRMNIRITACSEQPLGNILLTGLPPYTPANNTNDGITLYRAAGGESQSMRRLLRFRFGPTRNCYAEVITPATGALVTANFTTSYNSSDPSSVCITPGSNSIELDGSGFYATNDE